MPDTLQIHQCAEGDLIPMIGLTPLTLDMSYSEDAVAGGCSATASLMSLLNFRGVDGICAIMQGFTQAAKRRPGRDAGHNPTSMAQIVACVPHIMGLILSKTSRHTSPIKFGQHFCSWFAEA